MARPGLEGSTTYRQVAIGLFAIAVGATSASAVTDDLQCYKITNRNLTQLKGLVDLNAPSIGVAPGCKLGKAKLYCAPAETTVQPGTLFDGRRPVDTLPLSGAPGDSARICYGVTCKSPAGTGPDQFPIDRFGVHELARLKTAMVCTTATQASVLPTGFQINTPSVELPPGQEITNCYYFHTPNSTTAAIKKWTSRMPAHVLRTVLVFTSRDIQPPGTLSASNCGIFGNGDDGAGPHTWAYSANQPDAEFEFPADDGTGVPVAQLVPGGQSGYLWMHMQNRTNEPVTANVELNATEYPVAMPVTRADSYVAVNARINIPPGPGSSDSESLTCAVPAGAKFFSLSTHANKQSVHTFIKDAASTVFESTDFARPGSRIFAAPPFFTFASGRLTYQCDYFNDTGREIRTGENPFTDEMCVAVTFHFPSTKPRFCFNDFLLP